MEILSIAFKLVNFSIDKNLAVAASHGLPKWFTMYMATA